MISGPRDCLTYFKERFQKWGPLCLLCKSDVSTVLKSILYTRAPKIQVDMGAYMLSGILVSWTKEMKGIKTIKSERFE